MRLGVPTTSTRRPRMLRLLPEYRTGWGKDDGIGLAMILVTVYKLLGQKKLPGDAQQQVDNIMILNTSLQSYTRSLISLIYAALF